MSGKIILHPVAAILLSLFMLTLATPSLAGDELSLELPGGDAEVSIQRFPAQGKQLLIRLTPVVGEQAVNTRLAQQLAQVGVEVWLVDLVEARFLPAAQSSSYKLPASDVAALIGFAHDETGKRIYLAGDGATAIPILRGAHAWQLQHPDGGALAGVLFNSPNFFEETPDPGETGELMPIVSVTNLPVYILQPKLSPRYWRLKEALPVLEAAGSDVFVRILKNVRGRFYFRADAVALEQQVATQLPHMIREALGQLDALPQRPRVVKPLQQAVPAVREGKKDHRLTAYKGDPQPPALDLQSLSGQRYDLAQLKGRVVLVNFWTTWCPPCVHEMPSLQLLSKAFAPEQFLILGVNMAEQEAVIRQFLHNKVAVDFPILLDRDGAALMNWKVYAFPTSFIIGKQGTIRYALFGSIDWNTPPIIAQIRQLLDEAGGAP